MSNKRVSESPVVPAAPEKLLLDIPTAAQRLSTNVFAIRTLLRQGKIKYVRIGHAFLISPMALQEFIEKNQRVAA